MQRIATSLVVLCALVAVNGCKEKVEHLDTTPVQDSSYTYNEPSSNSSNYYSSAPVSSGSPSHDTGGSTHYTAQNPYPGASTGTTYQPQASNQSYAPAPSNAYAASTGGAGGMHTVQKGETLYALARMYYSDQSKWRVIYEANRASMSSPHSLRAGQELIIP